MSGCKPNHNLELWFLFNCKKVDQASDLMTTVTQGPRPVNVFIDPHYIFYVLSCGPHNSLNHNDAAIEIQIGPSLINKQA